VTSASDDVGPKSESQLKANALPSGRCVSALAGGILLFSGIRRHSVPLLMGGGALVYRSITGSLPFAEELSATAVGNVIELEETITVRKPADQTYELWRNFENLPRFMSHIESVTVGDDSRSHWVARLPLPMRLEWDAEIINDQPGKRIAWRSLPEASIQHSGSVMFHWLTTRQSTEVKILLSYKAPLGRPGAAVARLLHLVTANQIRADMRAFKAVAESGEKPTTLGQPVGRKIRSQCVPYKERRL
jgi:uncharacterized membrane protein